MRERPLRHCRVCGVSNREEPLSVYSDLNNTKWVYLCRECEVKVLAKTGGEIPLESLGKLGGGFIEEWEWEGEENRSGNRNNWKLAGRGMDLSRTTQLILRC